MKFQTPDKILYFLLALVFGVMRHCQAFLPVLADTSLYYACKDIVAAGSFAPPTLGGAGCR